MEAEAWDGGTTLGLADWIGRQGMGQRTPRHTKRRYRRDHVPRDSASASDDRNPRLGLTLG